MLTNDSILDIALSCGYENLSYFNRSFKKRYKKTPSEYRRVSDKAGRFARLIENSRKKTRYFSFAFLLFVFKTMHSLANLISGV